MSKPVLLNNVDHKHLRIRTGHAGALAERQMFAPTFPAEFRDLQACYPIVFRKSDDGTHFEPVALFGFEEGENLFLARDGWDAPVIPLAVARQPFLIGVDGETLLVHVDLDSPRCSNEDGEAVFLPHGGTTDFLEQVNSTLLALHQGLQATPLFMDALLALDLLESFVLDIELEDGSEGRLAGFYAIHEERLAALEAGVLGELHRAGYLQAIFMALASLSKLRGLIERKNAKNRAHASLA
jgi:hypothetical protein